MGTKDDLVRSMKAGDAEACVVGARKVLEERLPLADVLGDLTAAIREVGDAFDRFDIFLPDLVMASDAMVAIMKVFEPEMRKTPQARVAPRKVVIATVKGDIHEIGKNIVVALLSANGYQVVDLGGDVDSLEVVKAAEREGASLIGLSSLMTTTMLGQKEVLDILRDKGIRDRFKVIIGGAPTSEEWAQSIGADGWAKDASTAVRLADRLIRD